MLNRSVYNKREIQRSKITELTVGSRGVEHVLTECQHLTVIENHGTVLELANSVEQIVDIVGMNNPDIVIHSEFKHVCIFDEESDDDLTEITFSESLIEDTKDAINENIPSNSGDSNPSTSLLGNIDAKEIIELLNDKRLVENED